MEARCPQLASGFLPRRSVNLVVLAGDASLAEAAGGEEGGWRWWSSWSKRTDGAEGLDWSNTASCWHQEQDCVWQDCAPYLGAGGVGVRAAGCGLDGGGQDHSASTSCLMWQSQERDSQRLESRPCYKRPAGGMMEMQGQMWCWVLGLLGELLSLEKIQ